MYKDFNNEEERKELKMSLNDMIMKATTLLELLDISRPHETAISYSMGSVSNACDEISKRISYRRTPTPKSINLDGYEKVLELSEEKSKEFKKNMKSLNLYDSENRKEFADKHNISNDIDEKLVAKGEVTYDDALSYNFLNTETALEKLPKTDFEKYHLKNKGTIEERAMKYGKSLVSSIVNKIPNMIDHTVRSDRFLVEFENTHQGFRNIESQMISNVKFGGSKTQLLEISLYNCMGYENKPLIEIFEESNDVHSFDLIVHMLDACGVILYDIVYENCFVEEVAMDDLDYSKGVPTKFTVRLRYNKKKYNTKEKK